MTARARWWLLALLALAAGLALPRAAAAHGVLRRAQPASGARLDSVPREIRLTFNEPVELAVARIALRGADGALVPLAGVSRGDSATVIVAAVTGPLAPGTYTVEWQVAGRDGHPVRGSYRFTILPGAAGTATAQAPAAPAAPVGAAASVAADTASAAHGEAHHDPVAMPERAGFDAGSPAFAAVRWLGYVGLLALVGSACFALLVLPRARARLPLLAVAAERGARFATGALLLLLLAAALRLVAQSVATYGGAGAFSPANVGALVAGTGWGRAWLLQLAGIAVAGAGLALLARRERAGWVTVAAGAAVAALALALSGHAAAVPGRAPLAVASDTVHLLAAGGWLGTLLVVAAAGIRLSLRGEPGQRGPAAAALVDAFSPLALAFAGALVLTGVVSALMHVDSLAALRTTAYGRVLLVKLALLSLVLGTGAYNWLRVRPALGDERGAHRILRSASAELAIAALVLVATAVLTATPTAIDAARVAGAP